MTYASRNRHIVGSVTPFIGRDQHPDIAAANQNGLYKPLGEGQTRIARIQPGERGEPIEIQIRKVDISDGQHGDKYTALSYTWGEPNDKISLTVTDEAGTPHNLAVTRSLEVAIQYIRQKADVIVLWVDQLSINQSDPEGISSQIMLMREIH